MTSTSRRHLLLPVALAAVAGAAPARAQYWIPSGVPVCSDTCVASAPYVTSDAGGGIYVAWREHRNLSSTDFDVFVQRVNGASAIPAGWLPGGLPACTAAKLQEPEAIAADGHGGMFVAWIDQRSVGPTIGTATDVYVQRFLPNGQIAPGWPVDGTPATAALGTQQYSSIAPDGAGGAFVAWTDYRVPSNPDVYAQHLGADGVPVPGWPADGLAICALPSFAGFPLVLADGTGGVVIVWGDTRNGSDTYGTRVLADGSPAPGWPVNGLLLQSGVFKHRIAPDAAGGFFVASAVSDGFGSDLQYWVQRYRFDGARAPGWPEAGVLVCDAPGIRDYMRVAPDGAGGLLLSWLDGRAGSYDVYAHRVLADGALAPGWTPNGVLVSEAIEQSGILDLTPDGVGGVFVAWEWDDFAGSATRVRIQHLGPDGAPAPGWPAYGVPASTSPHQLDPKLAPDGSGGVIVVWDEAGGRFGLYAQRFGSLGPTPVLLSLATAEAFCDRVELAWQGPGAGDLAARIERREEAGAWVSLGVPDRAGPDRLTYADRAVQAGTRYAYRLAYRDEGAEQVTAETWVAVPATHALALSGFTPNPATRADLTVAFTLPASAGGTIELVDVTGRRVASRDLSALGAGRHVVRLAEGRTLSAGLYWIRLTHGGATRTARGVVVE